MEEIDQKTYRQVEAKDLSSKKARKGRPRKWPFMEMSVGQSVAVDDKASHHPARSAATYAGAATGARFKCVKMGNGTLLVKRIE